MMFSSFVIKGYLYCTHFQFFMHTILRFLTNTCWDTQYVLTLDMAKKDPLEFSLHADSSSHCSRFFTPAHTPSWSPPSNAELIAVAASFWHLVNFAVSYWSQKAWPFTWYTNTKMRRIFMFTTHWTLSRCVGLVGLFNVQSVHWTGSRYKKLHAPKEHFNSRRAIQ